MAHPDRKPLLGFQLDLHLCLSSQWLRPHTPLPALWRLLFAPRPHPLLLQLCRSHGRAALPRPLVLFLSLLGRLAASLVVARPQQFPFRLHGVMGLFQLDLHLCLRSQWLRPHPHSTLWRLLFAPRPHSCYCSTASHMGGPRCHTRLSFSSAPWVARRRPLWWPGPSSPPFAPIGQWNFSDWTSTCA